MAAGIVIGLAAPVVLSSRADTPPARLAALALASLIHHRSARSAANTGVIAEPSLHCAPQPEQACCPMPNDAAFENIRLHIRDPQRRFRRSKVRALRGHVDACNGLGKRKGFNEGVIPAGIQDGAPIINTAKHGTDP